MRRWVARSLAVGAAVLALAVLATPAAAQRHTVVLVSGLDSSSPFSTPAGSCAGKEGEAWGVPNGVAPALKAAKFQVFTAPVRNGSDRTPPPACAKPAPSSSTWLDSKGDVD